MLELRYPEDVTDSMQYGTPAVVVPEKATKENVDEIIDFARFEGAICNDGQDDCIVVQLPGRPIELYTERALRTGW